MAITKIQTGAFPADVVTTAAIDDLSVTHAKLHTDMDLSSKTVTLPSAITDTITNKLPLTGGTLTGPLTVQGNGNATMQWGDTTAIGALSFDAGDNPLIRSYTGKDLFFQTNGPNNRMVILSNGNVGIGVTDPSALLEIKDSTAASQSAALRVNNDNDVGFVAGVFGSTANTFGAYQANSVFVATSGTATELLLNNPNASGKIRFATGGSGGTERMRIRSDGNIHINTTTPDLVGNTTSLTIGGSSFGGDGMLSLQSGWGGTTYGRVFASGGKLKIGNPQSNDVELYTANLTRLKIDSDGRVTMPYQPVFAAYSPAKTSQNNYVVFGNTYTNVGGHYNTSNGRFTAPVAGTYFFNYNILMGDPYTGSYVRVLFRVNGAGTGQTLGDTLSDASATDYTSVHNTAVFTMSAGDYIQLYNEGPIPTYGTNYGNFGGYLIG